MGGFLKISGDYSNWNVYRKAVVICDVTEMFINRALPHSSRTIDQMRQAARSCKQNIVEGISDGTVSAEMCIKLLGVARGSEGNCSRIMPISCASMTLKFGPRKIRAQPQPETIASATTIRGSLPQNAANAAMKL